MKCVVIVLLAIAILLFFVGLCVCAEAVRMFNEEKKKDGI